MAALLATSSCLEANIVHEEKRLRVHRPFSPPFIKQTDSFPFLPPLLFSFFLL